jgi:hypothetical protein
MGSAPPEITHISASRMMMVMMTTMIQAMVRKHRSGVSRSGMKERDISEDLRCCRESGVERKN